MNYIRTCMSALGVYYLKTQYIIFLKKYFPQKAANIFHKGMTGRNINWKHPLDLNEKINWLKFNSDTSLWSEYADKYLVRNYVVEQGLQDILPTLYGVWDNAEDIEFDKLPAQYVLKTNHGCGTNIIVTNSSKLDRQKTIRHLNDYLKLKFGFDTAEPHYMKIKPRIIAEQYLKPKNGRLCDYKLFMINQKLELILVVSDREGSSYRLSTYDENWSFVPERLDGTHKNDNVKSLPRPASFTKMVKSAEILSRGFPQVRIDFYDIDGKLYFGEMTFTSQGGYMNYLSHKELLRMGQLINLQK